MSPIDFTWLIRFWWISSWTSPTADNGVTSMRSSVRPTAPSVEFSTGTTAKSACPASTVRNTSSIVPSATVAADEPNALRAAAWLKVPSGPRYAIRSGASSAMHADISSRKSCATAALGSGPGFSACRRASTCASRSGRNSVFSPAACFAAPTACAIFARSLKRRSNS